MKSTREAARCVFFIISMMFGGEPEQ